MNEHNPFPFPGLGDAEVSLSRQRHDSNRITMHTDMGWWRSLKSIIREPMFMLLLACASVYFFIGAFAEACFMLGAICLIAGISFYQDSRSRRAMLALKAFTEPFVTVIRNDACVKIPTADIVIGDYVVVAEGALIPADGLLKQAHDFSVNESILTGESFSVSKEITGVATEVYSGTLVASGQCVFEVSAIGARTRLGMIGTSIDDIHVAKTSLQLQIQAFVQKMALAGVVIFLLIWGINYIRSGHILDSLLKGLTIAMSVLPEEIPVAFASFMALGAYRLMKIGIIVKRTSTVEALGSATVLCTDKTGTITENRMDIYACYALITDSMYSQDALKDPAAMAVIATAMWASETVPFDAMEQAIHQLYAGNAITDERHNYQMIHEYPLSGKPPMMTHVFEDHKGHRIIACKGAPEALVARSVLSSAQVARINEVNSRFAQQGLRVLAIATADTKEELPETQDLFRYNFMGLVAFYDPPKKNIAQVFRAIDKAGIRIKLITGDNPETALAISKQVGLKNYNHAITGKELDYLSETDFGKAVLSNHVFSRIYPELKLRIVESLKQQGEVVGMTGDGVNDGPALKAAHIGIAMGRHGSEIAKTAASLILTDDDFGKMVDAVAMGRRIYSNLKKAIQYIISIHIPIILAVAIPSILGWVFPAIFTPVHVIFLELIMGPTCSIVYEREPMEPNSMLQPPHDTGTSFFKLRDLTISIIQGLCITAATLTIYQYGVINRYDEALTRSMVFSTLVLANVFLTLVNRSFYYSVITTLKNKNNLLITVICITTALLAVLVYVPAVAAFFNLAPLNLQQVLICLGTALISVLWFEVYKIVRRSRPKNVL